jgi:hypothetical protein
MGSLPGRYRETLKLRASAESTPARTLKTEPNKIQALFRPVSLPKAIPEQTQPRATPEGAPRPTPTHDADEERATQ